VQFGEVDRIAPVGLDPVSGLARDQRRSNHDALVTGRGKLALDAVATGPGLVTEPHNVPALHQLGHQCPQGGGSVGDLAVFSDFAPIARLGRRNCDRILVHVQPDVGDNLLHGPSPMHEARHRTSDATLVNLHTVRRVTPFSGEHLV